MKESKEFQAHIINKAIKDEDGRIHGPILVRSGRFGFATAEDEAEQIAKFKAGVKAIATLFNPESGSSVSSTESHFAEMTNLDACDLNVHNVLALKGMGYSYDKAILDARSVSAEWHKKTESALEPITRLIKKELRWDQLFEELQEKTKITKSQLINLMGAYYKLGGDSKQFVEDPVFDRMKHVRSKIAKESMVFLSNIKEQAKLFTDYTIEECAGVLAMRLLGYKTLLYLNRLNNPATTHMTDVKLGQCELLMKDTELEKVFGNIDGGFKAIIDKIDQNQLGLVEMSFSTIEPKKSSSATGVSPSNTAAMPIIGMKRSGKMREDNGAHVSPPNSSRATASTEDLIGSTTNSFFYEQKKNSPPKNSGGKLMASQYRLYTSNGAWPAVVDNQLEKEERKLMLLAKAFFSSFTGGESSEAVDARAAAYRRLAKEDDIESLVNGVTDQLGSLPLVEEAPVATEEARRRPAPGKTGTNAGTSTGSGN